MSDPGATGSAAEVRRWLARTPNRTFVLYPTLVLLERAATRHRRPVDLRFAPLLAWGYLEYRLVGGYRLQRGRGGPGVTVPPEALIQSGPYSLTRNPMYLGHLIFMLGLTGSFRSRLCALILVANGAWFHQRVVADEARLAVQFGTEYADYRSRVKRWIPGVL